MARAPLLILDCRTRTAATGNAVMGKGTESESYYRMARVVYLDIVNIHAGADH